MITIKKTSQKELEDLEVADGFTRWIPSPGDKGRNELKEILIERLNEGAEVWIAVENREIIGFAIVTDWPALPEGKAIEAMEVAKPYRGRGIGYSLLNRILKETEAIFVLTPYPEAGYEKALEEFYKRFDFKYLSNNKEFMVRIPENPEKLEKWIKHIDRLIDIYELLIKEMKRMYDEKYRALLKLVKKTSEEK
jgi:GNAT superfamily N-acetyltransferase